MATLEQLEHALVNADKAGDTEAAKMLASEIIKVRAAAKDEGGAMQHAGNVAAGAVRGAGSIGATLLPRLLDNVPMIGVPAKLAGQMAAKALDIPDPIARWSGNKDDAARRAEMDSALESMGAQPDSWMYKGGKLAGEVAGTAGAGGVMANGVRYLGASKALAGLEPIVSGVAKGLETGGFRVGELAGTGAGTLARVATGAATGGASAALVDPKDAAAGAVIGGAFPVGIQGAGAITTGVAKGMRKVLGAASPEVRALALRADELGIKIPADRLLDSKALNALGASLNYVPLSGRTATEEAMNAQLNRALSRTFGQDTSNVTMALRLAEQKLGGKFESTLSQTGVNFDRQLLEDLATVYNKAETELGSEALKPIEGKIREIVAKGESGVIDGKAAYAIKRDLDRIGKTNNPNAFHAVELKGVLMDALNRSLGPEKAAEFALTRRQYGNMLSLEKLAKNGVEGEISVARLANLPNINNKEVQELADIAAQFVKPREGMHGAAQRVIGANGIKSGLAGAGAAGAIGGVPAILGAGAVMGGARVANSVLNSNAAKNAILNGGKPVVTVPAKPMGAITGPATRALPVTGAGAVGAEEAEPVKVEEPPKDPIEKISSATTVDQAIEGAFEALDATTVAAAPAEAIQKAPTQTPVAQVTEQVDGSLMETTVAAAPAAVSTDPASIWTGRRGAGYISPGDAMMAMRTRQKVEPELDWKVERMPNDKFRLAGYARPNAPGLMAAEA